MSIHILLIINIVLCFIILVLSIIYSKKSGIKLSLYIGIAFGLFGISHVVSLAFGGESYPTIIIALRLTAYLIIISVLIKFLKTSLVSKDVQEAKDRLQLIFRASPEPVLLSRLSDGLIIDINDGFTSLTGFKSDEAIGKTSVDIKLWFDKNHREAMINELKKAGEIKNVEAVLLNKKGEFITCIISSRIIEIDNSPHILSVIRDISERKIMEEALRVSEEKQRKLVEKMFEGLLVVDNDDIIQFANPKFCELLGYELSELVGKTGYEILLNEKDRSAILKRNSDRLKGISERYELNMIKKNGETVTFLMNASPLDDASGTIIGSMATCLDITEQKHSQVEIMKMSIAIEQSPVSIVITDTRGIIEYVNPKFCELTGYSSEEAIGENPRILKSGEISKKYFQELWNTIKSGKTWRGELLNKMKSGKLYWESVSISPIFNSDGVMTHFVGVKEDITEQKYAREEMDRLMVQLIESKNNIEANLKQNTILLNELSASEAMLKMTLETKNKLFSIIAHDLKNPLSALIIGSDLLFSYYDKFNDSERINRIGQLSESSKFLLTMLENLLQWSSCQTGAIDFNPVNNDLVSVINNNIELLQLNANTKSINLITHASGSLMCEFDEDLITTVVRNLISNAIKFTPEKGKIEIGFNIESDGKRYQVFVKDSGVGIPQSKLEKLFKIEENISTTGTSGEKGTGLGLILCKEFVEKHNGRIWVESEVGQGSTFWFSLGVLNNGI